MVSGRADAVITFSDATTYNYPREIAELAMKNRLPMVSPFREVADAGALMAYGLNIIAMWSRSAVYVDKILRGASASELPIEQPTKFELVINLKTAKALSIAIPQSLLLRGRGDSVATRDGWFFAVSDSPNDPKQKSRSAQTGNCDGSRSRATETRHA